MTRQILSMPTTRQAVILVGGKGTRLGSLTMEAPKPMMAIGNKPFIHLLIEEIARHGFQDIILLCGHLAERIYSVFDGITVLDARVRCVVEPQPMGTGGALQHAVDLLNEEFLLLNGDSLFDLNLLDLQTLADGGDWLGKVALRSLPDTRRYGTVALAGVRITAFAEKAANGPGLINGGVYMLKREVVDLIQHIPCSLELDILPKLVAQERLLGRAYSGYFIDIGIPEDLQRAQAELPIRKRPTLFFDRDGVLNHDNGYTHRIEDFLWMPGVVDAIKLFNDRGWLVIVVTNQAGIAHGYYDDVAVTSLHAWMQEQLRLKGAHVDAFYYCPHHPEGSVSELATECTCRKPEPGMLLRAMSEWPVDRSCAFLIGDKLSDLEAASRAGVKGVLFEGEGLLDLAQRLLA
jgi:D-glycero-D-manno-heptose 1,7-bisphosphate phosphatase